MEPYQKVVVRKDLTDNFSHKRYHLIGMKFVKNRISDNSLEFPDPIKMLRIPPGFTGEGFALKKYKNDERERER